MSKVEKEALKRIATRIAGQEFRQFPLAGLLYLYEKAALVVDTEARAEDIRKWAPLRHRSITSLENFGVDPDVEIILFDAQAGNALAADLSEARDEIAALKYAANVTPPAESTSDFSEAIARTARALGQFSAEQRESFLRAWMEHTGVTNPQQVMLVEQVTADGKLQTYFILRDHEAELKRLLAEAPTLVDDETLKLRAEVVELTSALERMAKRVTEAETELEQTQRKLTELENNGARYPAHQYVHHSMLTSEEQRDASARGVAESFMRYVPLKWVLDRRKAEALSVTSYTGYGLRKKLAGLANALVKL